MKKIKSLSLYTLPQNHSKWIKYLNAKQNKKTKGLEEAKKEICHNLTVGKTFIPLLHNPRVREEKMINYTQKHFLTYMAKPTPSKVKGQMTHWENYL